MSNQNIILITRPQPQASRDALFFKENGIAAHCNPMLFYKDVDFDVPPLEGMKALIATSARALNNWSKSAQNYSMPIYCVGDQTAHAARNMGHNDVRSASGDAKDLCALILNDLSPNSRLLYIRGRDISADIASALKGRGMNCSEVITYEAQLAESLSPETLDLLQNGRIAATALYSVRSAENFARIVRVHKGDNALKRIKLLCISDAVIKCVRSLETGEILKPDRPDGDDLRALSVQIMTDINRTT